MKTEIISQPIIRMSSTEIAELTNKRHDNVVRDVWSVLHDIYDVNKHDSKMSHIKNQHLTLVDGVSAEIDYRGYVANFWFDKKHALLMVTGYDAKRRLLLIERIEQLEQSKNCFVTQSVFNTITDHEVRILALEKPKSIMRGRSMRALLIEHNIPLSSQDAWKLLEECGWARRNKYRGWQMTGKTELHGINYQNTVHFKPGCFAYVIKPKLTEMMGTL